jgi:hypothetical protein
VSTWGKAISRAKKPLVKRARAAIEAGESLACKAGPLYMDGDVVRVNDGYLFPEALISELREALGIETDGPPFITNTMHA